MGKSEKSFRIVEKILNINEQTNSWFCPYCDNQRSFHNRSNLKKHIASKHYRETKAWCSYAGCKKEFLSYSSRDRHENSEHLGKRYNCKKKDCFKTFKYPAGLR